MGNRMDKTKKRNKELIAEIDKLKRKIKTLKSKKKYGLVWEEEKEPEQIILDCQYKIPILKEVSAKKIITDKKKPTNILIEGDNYHALQVLNYTHKEKVTVIYIDPPYNTGKAKEWKYNDKFIDENDSYKHSKWLNFMNKRLLLAKNLLKNDGVIFISIDNNEFAQLKLLCDEIFGENNFVGCIIWRRRQSQANLAQFSNIHDYILIYSKNNKLINLKGFELDFTRYKNKDNDTRGVWDSRPLVASEKSSNKKYEYTFSNGVTLSRKWRYSFNTLKKFETKNKIYFTNPKNGKGIPRLKIFIKDKLNSNKYKTPNSLWVDPLFYGNNQVATKEIEKIFNLKNIFITPKPTLLIKRILEISTTKNSLILDFFAGSGTTGHAILDLNKEDGGNKKFILCTNNENNICTDVCYPRIKKVIKGYKNQKGLQVKGLGGNLRYFKTELLDVDHISHVSDEQKIKLTYKAGEMIALRENTFEEVEINEWWQIFKNGTKYTAIYFKEDKSKLNKLIKKLEQFKKKVTLYIFSWGKNEYKNEFTEYKNIKVNDIPEPIIDVYKEINRLRVII